jgi:hypothetical protein
VIETEIVLVLFWTDRLKIFSYYNISAFFIYLQLFIHSFRVCIITSKQSIYCMVVHYALRRTARISSPPRSLVRPLTRIIHPGMRRKYSVCMIHFIHMASQFPRLPRLLCFVPSSTSESAFLPFQPLRIDMLGQISKSASGSLIYRQGTAVSASPPLHRQMNRQCMLKLSQRKRFCKKIISARGLEQCLRLRAHNRSHSNDRMSS